jgi:hypothetical protein
MKAIILRAAPPCPTLIVMLREGAASRQNFTPAAVPPEIALLDCCRGCCGQAASHDSDNIARSASLSHSHCHAARRRSIQTEHHVCFALAGEGEPEGAVTCRDSAAPSPAEQNLPRLAIAARGRQIRSRRYLDRTRCVYGAAGSYCWLRMTTIAVSRSRRTWFALAGST